MKPQVTLYTRARCCLCEDAKTAIAAARQRVDFDYAEIDIDAHPDPDLVRLYDHEVPVVTINRRKAFKYKVDLNELLKKLAASI
jgi:glutaredoxin